MGTPLADFSPRSEAESCVFVDRFASPVGDVRVGVVGNALVLLDFADNDVRIERLLAHHYPGSPTVTVSDPAGVSTKLRRYFDGDLTALDDIAVAVGGTPFHRQIWLALRDIPVGTTTSYGRLAAAVGRPSASRAVGAANGSNPIAIVLPCHRVVGANGTLTGYAGGLDRKTWLLRHEGALL